MLGRSAVRGDNRLVPRIVRLASFAFASAGMSGRDVEPTRERVGSELSPPALGDDLVTAVLDDVEVDGSETVVAAVLGEHGNLPAIDGLDIECVPELHRGAVAQCDTH